MSLFTRKMKMLTAVVLDTATDRVVKALLSLGVMDFISVKSLGKDNTDKLKTHSSYVSASDLAEMRVRVEGMLKTAKIGLPTLDGVDVEELSGIDMDAYQKKITRLSNALQNYKDGQKEINQALLNIDELTRYLEEDKKEYLDLRVGSVNNSTSKELEKRLHSFGGIFIDGNPVISLTLKRDSARISPIFDKFNWTETSDIKKQKDSISKIEEEIVLKRKELVKQNDEIQEEIEAKIREVEKDLNDMWINLRYHELSEFVGSHFSYTKNTTLFSGWVPVEKASETEDVIRQASGGKYIAEWTEETEVRREDIPVLLENPKILKPFERLVNNYSTPEYGSINPTPFTAVAYMIMFMLMFADVGQGLVLLLIGIIGKKMYEKHPEKKDGIISRYLCSLLLYLGPASMLGGVLFGSYFGYSLLPALWFNYHNVVNGHAGAGLVQSVYDILGITIKFGICVIGLGLVLNWINLFRKKRYLVMLFDKNGILGGVFYALGIWAGFYFVGTDYKEFPSSPILLWGLVICIILLFLKGPIFYIVKRKNGGEKESVGKLVIDVIMDFIVEALEIFSGFLANTLSFMRVAGLGIAHVSLMTAFQDMANMTGNIVFTVLIMILGNVLVIALEGLSAGIQSLRLNYYEFFTKYFTGKGIAFSPVGLKSRISL